MAQMLWKGGRLAWPPVLAALFSTFAIVATDYAWRMVQGSLAEIVLGGVLLFVTGNAAIFVIAKRSR